MRPIDGLATLMQSLNVQELLNSAQREAALAQIRHESDTEKAKDIYQHTVTRKEEANAKLIRDDDPRKERRQQRDPEEELGNEDQDEPPKHINIVI